MHYRDCPSSLLPPSAVTFDAGESQSWIISSLLVFALDSVVYHSVGIVVKASAEFLLLVGAGTDASTLPRGAGKLVEQIRWLCINFYE